jgi:hypothetical protein
MRRHFSTEPAKTVSAEGGLRGLETQRAFAPHAPAQFQAVLG